MLAGVIHKIAAEEYASGKQSAWRPRCSGSGPGKCVRAQVYHALGVPREPLPGRAALVFDDGNWHEELTADWIRRSAFDLHSQQMEVTAFRLSDGTPVTGHIDGILRQVDSSELLYEHKAINSYTWERHAKGVVPWDYVAQVICYLSGLKDIGEIAGAVLLEKNKNTAAYLEFGIALDLDETVVTLNEVTSDPEHEAREVGRRVGLLREIRERFEAVQRHRAEKTIPAREYHFENDWQCGYCSWGGLCWDGYAKELKHRDVELSPEAAEKAREVEELRQVRLSAEKAEKAKKREMAALMHEAEAASGASENHSVEVAVTEKDGKPARESVKVKRRKTGRTKK